MRIGIVIVFLGIFMTILLFGGETRKDFLSEEFDSLSGWRSLTFDKIKSYSKYFIIKKGSNSYLKTVANDSASGIILKKSFNVYDFPKAEWKWSISNVYQKGDGTRKSGDDYPIRIYIMFKYDPDKASAWTKVKYNVVKAIYGEYPPHAALSYVWSSRNHKKRFITSPYTDRAKMVVLRSTGKYAKKWKREEVDILDDYRKAFNEDPPSEAGIAIMSDSDNTGESANAIVDYIKIFREE